MPFGLKKLRISFIAKKEAKGLYRELFGKHPSRQNGDRKIDLCIHHSNWTDALGKKYQNSVGRTLNREKRLGEIYSQIKKCYAMLKVADDELENKKSKIKSVLAQIDGEIHCIEIKIEEMNDLVKEFHQGKPLPHGETSHSIITSKENFEAELSQKKAERERTSDLSSIQKKHDEHVNELRRDVVNLETEYDKRIDMLNRKVLKKEIQYNDELHYFLERLYRYFQKIYYDQNNDQGVLITKFDKQIKEIVEDSGGTFLSREKLHSEERAHINGVINTAMGIEYKV